MSRRRAEPHPDLRKRAEQRSAERPADAAPAKDSAALIHELRVHQIELEIQNEELVAARAQAESALRGYTELFDFAPIASVVLDASGMIRDANLRAARMFELPRRKLEGRHFWSLLDPSRRIAFTSYLAKVLSARPEEGGGETFEATLETPRFLEVRLTATVVLLGGQCALVAIEDVTMRKRAEESKRKDEFLAALSHELRNPLAPIRSGLAMLERCDLGNKASRTLSMVSRQVDHLVHIVDDLLDVTRIAHGKIRLVSEGVDLGELLRCEVDDHRASFETRGVALAASLPRELLCVSADRTRLMQVLDNVLGNALKFTPKGGRVEVGLRRDDGVGVLTVRDSGVGIAPEVRESLFQPFVQAPQSLERSHGGLGLGLAMVKGLVDLQGGRVDVTSEGLGKGTEVTIRLPLVEAGGHRPASPQPEREARGRRVLVIDDNADAADSLRDLLAFDGHDVRDAYDGPAGIALAHDFHPEIILCDIGLPGMDGYDVARAIRADDALKHAYLVALTGYARPEDRERAAAAGFDRHVVKPPSTEALDEVMASAPIPVAAG